MSESENPLPETNKPRKRRRWPWVILLLLVITFAGLLLKLRSDMQIDRERMRVWKAEAQSAGFFCANVSFGRPFGYQLKVLDSWMSDKFVAVEVRDDDAAARLMEIQTPPPWGLILVDEGLSSDVAARLQQHYPRASMPKAPAPPAAAGPAAPSPVPSTNPP